MVRNVPFDRNALPAAIDRSPPSFDGVRLLSIRRKTMIVRILMFAALWLSGCMFSVPIDISGLWTGTITWTTGPATGLGSPLSLDILLDSRDVSGTITLKSHGTLMFDLPITQGSAKNSTLLIKAAGVNPHVPSSPTVSITLDGNYHPTTMSGTGSQTIDGTVYTFTWEATFVAPPPETPTPAAL